MSRFDWPALMRAGLQQLRLSPETFWRLSPAELALMLGQPGGRAALGRDGLRALMARWPDAPQGETAPDRAAPDGAPDSAPDSATDGRAGPARAGAERQGDSDAG